MAIFYFYFGDIFLKLSKVEMNIKNMVIVTNINKAADNDSSNNDNNNNDNNTNPSVITAGDDNNSNNNGNNDNNNNIFITNPVIFDNTELPEIITRDPSTIGTTVITLPSITRVITPIVTTNPVIFDTSELPEIITRDPATIGINTTTANIITVGIYTSAIANEPLELGPSNPGTEEHLQNNIRNFQRVVKVLKALYIAQKYHEYVIHNLRGPRLDQVVSDIINKRCSPNFDSTRFTPREITYQY